MHWTKANFLNISTYDQIRKTYPEASQTTKMESFVKIVNGSHSLTISAKSSILLVFLGSKYTFAFTKETFKDKYVNFTFRVVIR